MTSLEIYKYLFVVELIAAEAMFVRLFRATQLTSL